MSKEMWNENFSEKKFIYGKEPNEFVKAYSGVIPDGAKVVCFAEGEGRNAVYLAENGYDVSTYDQSEVGLEKTKELAKERQVDVKTNQKDLIKETVEPNLYDAAVMVFGHVPRQNQSFFIQNMIDSVKPGGYIMFEVYSHDQLPYQSGGPKSEELLYHPKEVLDWIEPYKCLHYFYGEAERYEGDRHYGLSHVIQVIIQKV
ncbi:2-polyprenyl-3-methyl-5-hydroxy-6-metoxy-1,4-benzoquinol methylase [Alkalibacillus filiformis]|uniref:2-polyprenyl-3-methyl-5-hydroxy-6-metoxy-1, 4-benzoquinol methylase n=1 Tax=Alkalibacillus filiformis TaxID=200990 RepID=A0ABU0DUK9_9BACI|nr:methyltransferase domain-containing protein [Alkalibacillus filiformis]MDQ0352040.1 2-polyprenyl-3-methyl-5-hydroxy-6-metoxy-1,4-benzoquinol methylase [Alkalibacillus filiformis]